MSRYMRPGSRAHNALSYMINHKDGISATIAYREHGNMNLHSTISDLRNRHGADFICTRPIFKQKNGPKQYFICESDLPRARHMLMRVGSARKAVAGKGKGVTDAVES